MPIVRPSPNGLNPLTRRAPSTVALVCGALSLVQLNCGAPASTSDVGGLREIEATQPVAAQIAGDRHTYRVTLQAGHSVRVLADQNDTDLALTVVPPDGRPLPPVDTRERGVESVTILADGSGVFKVDVHAVHPGKGGGAYKLRLEAPPQLTTPRGRLQQRVESLASEGKRLAADPAAEAQRTALEQLRASLPLWRELQDSAGEAASLATIGDVLHARGEFKAAEAAYLQALTLGRRLGDRRQVGELLNNIGVGQWRRGALRDAMRYFEEALDEWRALPLRAGEAATLTNEGNLFFESSDYQQAIDRYVSALKISQSDNDPRGEAYALNNIGVTYRALGDLDAALTYVSRALPQFRVAGEELAEGRALVRLGQIQLARGDARTAETTAEKALAVIRRTDDRVAEADALDVLGQIAFVLGRTQTALSHHEQALTRYRATGSRRGEATALHHMGTVLVSDGEPARGLDALNRALAIRHEAGLRDAEAETLHQIALVEWRAGNLSQAQTRLRAALALAEDVRGRVAGEYSRTTYFAARQTYFAAYIDVLMQLHERYPSGAYAARAFETSERERARSLLDLLEESRSDIRRGVDNALLDQEREQRRQLDFWSYRLAALVDRKGAEDQAAEVREKIREVLADYRETQARIRVASPHYAALTSPPPLSVAEVQREVLDPETILLRFMMGDRQSYAWVMTHRSLRVVALPARAEIDPVARRVYELVSEKRLPSNATELLNRYQHEAEKLSAMLLRPVAAHLKTRRLLIVCDGALQFVPFAALPEPGARSLMLDRYEIVLLPSATTLAVLRRQIAGRSPAPKMLAVLADPVYEPNDPRVAHRVTRGSTDTGAVPPARLPFSRFEGESILSLVPPSERYGAFGFAASRETATGPVLRDYRIVHFAAHAWPDHTHPELSGIVLSLVDATGARQNGLLRIPDIHDMSLRADLVVLSACQTAIGKDIPGEGVMGLARGFFSAGAPRVVASQYKVEDEATAELMRAFYQAMFGPDRRTPAAALRAAKIEMAAHPRWHDPYWWSAFDIIGEPR